MREIIFHLGLPKTGTSALQVFFARNRGALLKQSFDYLRTGEFALGERGIISAGNGAGLARSILKSGVRAPVDDPRFFICEFFSAIENSGCERGLVSSEMLIGANSDTFRRIISRLAEKGVKARALYFIREQAQLLSSLYMQQVKRHRCMENATDYVRRVFKRVEYLRYYSLFRYLESLFGSGNLICQVYNTNTVGEPFYETTLDALSLSTAEIDLSIGDVNTSMSREELEIMLLLNRSNPRQRFSDFVVENSALTKTASSGQVHNVLPLQLVEEIQQYFSSENDAFAKQYYGQSPLFPIEFNAQNSEIPATTLRHEDVVAFLGGLLVRFDRRIAILESRLSKG